MEAFHKRLRLRKQRSDLVVQGLRVFWVTVVLWGEIGVFYWSLSDCTWPDKSLAETSSRVEPAAKHILLIADPYVLPPSTKSLAKLTSWLSPSTWPSLRREAHLHKSWSVTRRLHPDLIVFLGDMLGTGRSMQDDIEFDAYVHKFRDTFRLDEEQAEVRFIPGNGDVGLGSANHFAKHVSERYASHFGPPNQQLHFANHSLVLLDAPGLVNEDYQRAGRGTSFDDWTPLKGGAIEFVKDIAIRSSADPTILFTHIPLHRSESRNCGPLRERGGSIHRGVGKGWQSMLGKQTSAFLLETLKPVAVFSADDRDYCEVEHTLPSEIVGRTRLPGKSIHEITVKSFSPSVHITRPGFQLLSLLPASSRSSSSVASHSTLRGLSVPSQNSTQTYTSKLCLLPATSSTALSLYLPIFFLSFAVLFIAHYNVRRTRAHKLTHALSNSVGVSDWSMREKLEFLPKFTDGIRFPLNSSRAPGYGGEDSEKSGADTPSRYIQPSTYFEMPLPASSPVPKTPRTPWTPWSPVPVSGFPGSSSQQLPRTPRTPQIPLSRSTSNSNLTSLQYGPDDEDDDHYSYGARADDVERTPRTPSYSSPQRNKAPSSSSRTGGRSNARRGLGLGISSSRVGSMTSLSGGAVGVDEDYHSASGPEGSGSGSGESGSADNEASEGEYVYVGAGAGGRRGAGASGKARQLSKPPSGRSVMKDPEAKPAAPLLRERAPRSVIGVLRWGLRNCVLAVPRMVRRGGGGLGKGREKRGLVEGVFADLVRVVWPAMIVWMVMWWWFSR